MARGRKKVDDPRNKVLSIRLTATEKELLDTNPFIKDEVVYIIREHINMYNTNKNLKR